MKVITVIVLTTLCCLNSLSAQDTVLKHRIYRAWLSLNSTPFKTKGVLYEVGDSSIIISSALVMKDYSAGSFQMAGFHINNIESIRIRRKNNIGKGILIGAMAGMAAGGLIGLISGDDPPCPQGSFVCFRFTAGEKALIAGIPLAACGVGVGAAIGSIKVRIPINGNIDNYNKSKSRLKEYSLKKKRN